MQLHEVIRRASLTPLQVEVLRVPLELPADLDAEVIPQTAFHMFVVGLIHRLKWLDADQRLFLTTTITPYLRQVLAPFDFKLAFCDSFQVTWTGLSGFYDLRTGEQYENGPPPFETLVYNFSTMMQRLPTQEAQGCPPEMSGPTTTPSP
jgi:hypothetical protein